MTTTPWGESQQCYKITDGVFEVMTGGHGGIMVRKDVAPKLLSPAAIHAGHKFGEWICYEEDCDWAFFAFEQPDIYTKYRTSQSKHALYIADTMKKQARASLSAWHPHYLKLLEDPEEEPAKEEYLVMRSLDNRNYQVAGPMSEAQAQAVVKDSLVVTGIVLFIQPVSLDSEK